MSTVLLACCAAVMPLHICCVEKCCLATPAASGCSRRWPSAFACCSAQGIAVNPHCLVYDSRRIHYIAAGLCRCRTRDVPGSGMRDVAFVKVHSAARACACFCGAMGSRSPQHETWGPPTTLNLMWREVTAMEVTAANTGSVNRRPAAALQACMGTCTHV